MHMAIVFCIGLAIVGLIAILAVNSESRRRRARESTPDYEASSAGRTESSDPRPAITNPAHRPDDLPARQS